MAIKPTKIDAEKQIRAGDDGDMFAVIGGAPSWATPAEAGVATEEFVVDQAEGALESAKEYTDTEIDLAKAESQNYTDDAVGAAELTIEGKLANKADLLGGVVPASQLPGFAETFQVFPSVSDFPAEGDPVVIYVAEDVNESYRWTGSSYVAVTSGVQLGETSETAYRGDRGKDAFDHTLRTDNPHNVNKTQVGLSNVDNTSDADKPVSIATSMELSGKADALELENLSNDVGDLEEVVNGKADASDLEELEGVVEGKEDAFTKGDLIQGDNVTLTGDLEGRLVGSGNITISAEAGGGGGDGDVVGPSSATDRELVAYDGTSGKLIRGTGVTSTDAGLTRANSFTLGTGTTSNLYMATEDGGLAQLYGNSTAMLRTGATMETMFLTVGGDAGAEGMRFSGLSAGTILHATPESFTYNGVPVVTTTGVQDLSGKRVRSRFTTGAPGGVLFVNKNSEDVRRQWGLTTDIELGASGAVTGEKVIFIFSDDGTPRNITLQYMFQQPSSVTLPATTTPGKTHYVEATTYDGDEYFVTNAVEIG